MDERNKLREPSDNTHPMTDVHKYDKKNCICTPKFKAEISLQGCGDLIGYCDVLQMAHNSRCISNGSSSFLKSIDFLQRKNIFYTSFYIYIYISVYISFYKYLYISLDTYIHIYLFNTSF